MFPRESRILLAEDMSSVREIVVETFYVLGFDNIVECKDGAEAWEKIQNDPQGFSLVVSDFRMPNSNGMDLLIRIRASEKFKNLPFLMISSQSDKVNILSAISAGADHYLVKPFEAMDLLDKLKVIHEKRYGAHK